MSDYIKELTRNDHATFGELMTQLSEARAEIERLNKALEYVKAAHKKLSQLPSDLQIIEDQLDKLTEARALLDEMNRAISKVIYMYDSDKPEGEDELDIKYCREALAKYSAWKGGAG